MSTEEQHKKNQASTSQKPWLLTTLCLFNLAGLGYVGVQTNQQHHLSEQQFSEIKASNLQSESQIKVLEQMNANLEQQSNRLQQQIAAKPRPKASVLHLKWLLKQAKWQMNIMYQPGTSRQLLELAKKITIKQHWGSLEEAINHDINQLNQLNLTDFQKLVSQINGLQTELAKLHPAETYIKAEKASSSELPSYLKPFQPFIQIEKLKANTVTVVPPATQFKIIQNMQLLLPQIQYAGVSHQQALFNTLVEQLANQWQMISHYFSQPLINQFIDELKQDKFELDKPLRFESTSEVHLLVQQLNKSKP